MDSPDNVTRVISSITCIVMVAQPFIAAWLSRSTQPNPIPEPNQQKQRIHKNSVWPKILLWLSAIFCICFNLYALFSELHKTGPVTRDVVLHIAMPLAIIVFGVLNVFIILIYQVMDRHLEISATMAEWLSHLTDTVTKLSDLASNLQVDLSAKIEAVAASTRPAPGKLHKLLDAFKNLLSD